MMLAETAVLRLRDIDADAISALCARYGLTLVRLPADAKIPGSFWGETEAGLVGSRLYARADTPLHSLLHEACHFVCMDAPRRDDLDTDAGGDYDEENGVCYLQILLAGEIPAIGRRRMCADMDAWGYTFRLGSAAAWFADDAEDALAWLQRHGIVGADGRVRWGDVRRET